MVSEPVDAKQLEVPLNLTPPTNLEIEKEVISKIVDAIYHAQNPMILVDVLTARFHCTPEVRKLVDWTRFPVLQFLNLLR
jgi:TPP-dependent 2-oxoacid decarboxylase